MQNINIPDSVQEIGIYAFEHCTNLETIKIPADVKTISSGSFQYTTNLKNIEIDENNENFIFENGLLLSKDKTIVYCGLSYITAVNLPNEVTTIIDSAFAGCNNLTAFYGMNIKQFTVPSSIKTIESAAFDNCYNLEKIEIPSTIETIGETAFSRCTSLSQIIIHKEESSIAGAPWGVPLGDRAVIWDE